jgi:hypothetical protein
MEHGTSAEANVAVRFLSLNMWLGKEWTAMRQFLEVLGWIARDWIDSTTKHNEQRTTRDSQGTMQVQRAHCDVIALQECLACERSLDLAPTFPVSER